MSKEEGEVARFEIGEREVRVVPCDDTPGDVDGRVGEIARFVIEGKAFALFCAGPPRSAGAEASPARILTARELQIATLVAQGLLNKEVADRLRISEWTVCAHLRRIYSKLNVSTRGAMVYRCAAFVIDKGTP